MANLVLAAVALGVPGYRGRLQAQASQAAFERFLGCLLDGEPAVSGGLALPAGSEVRFAERALQGPASWPTACVVPLEQVAPAEAIFVFPSIKQTGADVRAVVTMITEELRELAATRRKGLGGVPERPLLMVEKLRAAMTLLAQAAGTDAHINADAVRFPTKARVEEPARLPLMGRQDGPLALWGTPTGIEAIAVDPVGISWLSLDDGRVDRRRARRTGLVRGVLTMEQQPYVVWATPEHRCTEREDNCARRATGVAPFDRGSDALPEPTWLAGHPAGRLDRSMSVRGRTVHLLTRGEPGAPIALRRFELPEAPLAIDKAPPILGEVLLTAPNVGEAVDALLVSTTPAAAVFSERLVNGQLRTTLVTQEGQRELPAVEGPGAWSKLSAACQDGSRALAYGTERQLRLGRLTTTGAPDAVAFTASPPADAPVAPVLDRDSEALDRMRVLCAETTTHLAYLDADHGLWLRACTLAGDCGTATRVADNVHYFDALLHRAAPIVAMAGDRHDQQIRVLGPGSPSPVIPAPCWDPRRGFCGAPTLVSDGERLLLAARELGDLLLMEADMNGTTWRTMSGLKLREAVQSDASAPMDQHLIRKGLKSAYE